jgi:sugar diacid utilization regulator
MEAVGHRAAVAAQTMEPLVAVLTERRDELVARGVERIHNDIPAYARQPDAAFAEDVRAHVAVHHDALVRSLALGRPLSREELSFIRPVAGRRVGRIPLASFMRGFRTYMDVLWEAVLETAVDDRTKDTALVAVGIIMRYIDLATTEAAEVYVEAERLQSAQGERLRRDLVEDLLSGRPPAPGPKLAAARDAGLADGAQVVLVVAAPVGDAGDVSLRTAASAVGRAFGSVVEPLTVVRQQEVICVAPAHAEAAVLERALEQAQRRLAGEGIVLAVGISAVAHGLGEVPEAYGEASAAVERVRPDGGVLSLSTMSAFDCLTLFGRRAAQRRIPAPIRTFVAEDRADGGALIATLRAYAKADFNVKAASAQLFVHPNTARYRLGKIEDRTGLDLRSFADVQELLIAVRVDELSGTP